MSALSVVIEDGIAVITMDLAGEPVNKINRGLRDEFERVFDLVEDDETVGAAVLISGKPDSFVAS